MLFTNSVFVTTSFIGLHQWPDAPEQVEFLRNPHRHVFKVRAELFVTHDDRELEFILVKEDLDGWLRQVYEKDRDLGTSSCEAMGQAIALYLNSKYPRRVQMVEVAEDGENGAVVRPIYGD